MTVRVFNSFVHFFATWLSLVCSAVERMNRIKMWKPQYAMCLRLLRPIVFDIPELPPEPSGFNLQIIKYYNEEIEEDQDQSRRQVRDMKTISSQARRILKPRAHIMIK